MPDKPELKRSISLPLLTFYGLGNILGAGIYILIGEVAGTSGLYTPIAFLLSAVLAAFTAFSYAELSARYPLSAGEAVYIHRGFSQIWLSRLVGLLIAVIGMVSAAAITRGFVGYLDVFIILPDWLVITLILAAMGSLAIWGISESLRTAAVFTLLEIAGLLLIIWVAAPALEQVPDRIPELLPGMDWSALHLVLPGAFLAFFAFIGFEDMVNVAEEVKNPQRTLPAAIIIALIMTTVLYIAVSLVAILAVPTETLAGSDAPLALVYRHATGNEPVLISIISLFAVINGALIQIIMASRVCYGMGCKRWLPLIFARVHAVTRTPVVATVSVSTAVLVMALYLPIETLAKSTSYFLLLVFCLVNLSLWRLKTRGEQPVGIVCVPRWIPVAGFTASLAFVLLQGLLDLRA